MFIELSQTPRVKTDIPTAPYRLTHCKLLWRLRREISHYSHYVGVLLVSHKRVQQWQVRQLDRNNNKSTCHPKKYFSWHDLYWLLLVFMKRSTDQLSVRIQLLTNTAEFTPDKHAGIRLSISSGGQEDTAECWKCCILCNSFVFKQILATLPSEFYLYSVALSKWQACHKMLLL